MDRTLIRSAERRIHPRAIVASTPWQWSVLVRPGREARLVDISDGGALIEIGSPLRPATSVQLQLMTDDARLGIHGLVTRCYVNSIDPEVGVRYRAAIRFDVRLSPPGDSTGEYQVPRMGTRDTTHDGQSLPASVPRSGR